MRYLLLKLIFLFFYLFLIKKIKLVKDGNTPSHVDSSDSHKELVEPLMDADIHKTDEVFITIVITINIIIFIIII